MSTKNIFEEEAYHSKLKLNFFENIFFFPDGPKESSTPSQIVPEGFNFPVWWEKVLIHPRIRPIFFSELNLLLAQNFYNFFQNNSNYTNENISDDLKILLLSIPKSDFFFDYENSIVKLFNSITNFIKKNLCFYDTFEIEEENIQKIMLKTNQVSIQLNNTKITTNNKLKQRVDISPKKINIKFFFSEHEQQIFLKNEEKSIDLLVGGNFSENKLSCFFSYTDMSENKRLVMPSRGMIKLQFVKKLLISIPVNSDDLEKGKYSVTTISGEKVVVGRSNKPLPLSTKLKRKEPSSFQPVNVSLDKTANNVINVFFPQKRRVRPQLKVKTTADNKKSIFFDN